MMGLLWAVVLASSLVKRVQSASLGTPFTGPNNDPYADGDKFTILTGSSEVLIERFDIHMRDVTAAVQVWTRNTYPAYSNTNDYTKRWEGNVTGLGQGVATPMPAFNLLVAANSTLGVYVTTKTTAMNHIFHSNGTLDKKVFALDDYISICEGLSSKYFHGIYRIPTKWNGESQTHHRCFDDA
jgi:hypothetical protein